VVFRDESATNGRHLRFSVGFDAGAPDCFELSPQHEVECAGVAGLSREARARLRISDLIVHGDLIPCLVPAAPRTEACP
jgi:hypothetical protein